MTLTIKIDGREIRPPIEYSIDLDMLEPTDAFTATVPLDKVTADRGQLDAPFQLSVDGAALMTGWLGQAQETTDNTLLLRGMDKAARLVAESVPGAGMRLGSTTVEGSALRVVEPWYDTIEFSNAKNRRLSRGRGRKSRSGREPSITAAQRRQIPRRIEAGAKRWEALMSILEPLRLLAWSRGDGTALVIAAPNYEQAPQYWFSEAFDRSNVMTMGRQRSVDDRYSIVEVSGSGRPPGIPAPPFFPAFPGQKRPRYVNRGRIGIARDTTGDFQRQKRLFVNSEALSQGEAQELAERMLGQGLVNAEQIEVEAPGHGQVRQGTTTRTLYAFDTIARVRRVVEAAPGDDRPAVLYEKDMYITRVNMASSRQQGETTRLTLSPVGAALS